MRTIYFALVFFLLSTCLYSTIINVPADRPTIQAGMDAPVDADTVLVQPGTYFENINYNGKNITVASLFLTTQDTSYVSQTVIDGNQNGSVVLFNNGESLAVLSGFTITNGYSSTSGGGISCVYSVSPTLKFLKIISNSAAYNGGGIICGADADPTLEDVLISNNIAGGDGGGVYCYNQCNPSFLNVTISGNSGFHGGGICCLTYSAVHMENCIISDNVSNNSGGGIFCGDNSNSYLLNATITGNIASNGGGGLYSAASSPNIINSILWNDLPNEITGSVNITYSDIEDGWAGLGNIDEDPLFVGTGDHPFMLQDLSLCINAGTPDTTGLNLPEFDLAGNPRIYGGRIDMGAYENQNVIVNTDENLIPIITKLNQNYPNPFNPTTTISFSLTAKDAKNAKIGIYNLKGQKVKTFAITPRPSTTLRMTQAGSNQYSVIWNGRDDNNKPVSSGIYFYKLKTDNNEQTKKMILIK